jgi:tRNA(Ile)-lysidine synthase
MLCVRREEIVEYLSLKGYRWMDDHTNEQLDYTRNRIRHLLLPDMQEASSGDIAEKLWEMSQLCRSLQGRVERLVDDMWDEIVIEESGERVVFAAGAVAGHSEAVGVEIINRAVEMLGCGQGKLNEFHYRSILELSEGQCGGVMDLPGDYRARRAGGELIFERITEAEKEVGQGPGRSGGGHIKVPMEGEVCFGGWRVRTRRLTVSGDDLKDFLKGKDEFVEWLDAGKVEGDIIARRRRTGDRFVPFGSGSSKRVGKFLTANQLSPDKKKKVAIFADNHKILWVSPVRLSGLAGVDETTREVLEIRIWPR